MLKSCFLICQTLILILAATTASSETYGNVVVDEVTSIYDADTFRASIDGWPGIIGKRVPVRVKGIDAPELRGKCAAEIGAARQAKQVAVSLIREAKVIELRSIERGKYFRVLADVHLDGVSLGQELMRKGLARPYDGGKKSSWCR